MSAITSSKISIGILGATGLVGQTYMKLLQNHPFFELAYVGASENSAGKTYAEAVQGRWQMDISIPETIANMVVTNTNLVENIPSQVQLVFSCIDGTKEQVQQVENALAKRDLMVISNSSANRQETDILVLIPEINYNHLDIVKLQQENQGFHKGFIVTKPNCSIQSYMLPVYALIQAGYEVEQLMVTTMQAVSGSGYPGVASLDILDNLIPFISGEEEKTEQEPLKIFGQVTKTGIQQVTNLKISA